MEHSQVQLKNRPCLVIGSNDQAVNYVERLLQAGARITLATPKLKGPLKKQAIQGNLAHHQGCFNPQLMENQALIVAATDNPLSNLWIAEHAALRNIPVKVAD